MVPESLPESLLVVGSGAIGMEFASFYRDLGVEVTVVDADSDAARLPALEAEFPSVAFERVLNQGYAGGANRLLEFSARARPDAEFSLILNPDTFLEPDFCEVLLASLQGRPDVALATGKLFRSDRSRFHHWMKSQTYNRLCCRLQQC